MILKLFKDKFPYQHINYNISSCKEGCVFLHESNNFVFRLNSINNGYIGIFETILFDLQNPSFPKSYIFFLEKNAVILRK